MSDAKAKLLVDKISEAKLDAKKVAEKAILKLRKK
jgi:hypothetical protein